MARFGIVVGLLALLSWPLIAGSPPYPQSNQAAPSPLTLDEVIRLLKRSKNDRQSVSSTIAQRGVSFEMDEKTSNKLRKAGADDELLAKIWEATPTGKAQMQALLTSPSGADIQASAEEAMALQDIQSESAADRRLQMVDAFEKKFPNSALLSYVDTEAAKAYQEKGDSEKAEEFCRKSLKLDPDNTFSLIILAMVLPQPESLKKNPGDAGTRLSETESDARRALTLLEKLGRRPDESDSQFEERKGSLAADAHFALGMEEMQRNDFDKAVTEYQTAISSSKKPRFQYYYRLAEADASEGRIPDAIEALQKASELARGTPMQKYADDFMSELQKKAH